MKPIRERLEAWGDSGVLLEKATDSKEIQNVVVAIGNIEEKHRKMLLECFIYHTAPTEICRRLGILSFPSTNFIDAFLAAEQALETALKEIEK